MSNVDKSNIDILKEIGSKKVELNAIKLQILLDKEKNKRLIKSKKKDIARLLTIKNRK
ncbi:50S ribosomal protein L29 [bacterium]|nr:50S ribosomal protein L29 [bacterium]|tara:strand:+ start:620 stop:793 length:174 start_codon:yes stop_codon:yes gene_type:complete